MKSAFPLRNPKEHSNFTLENSSLLWHLTMGVGALIMSVSSSRRLVGRQAKAKQARRAVTKDSACLLGLPWRIKLVFSIQGFLRVLYTGGTYEGSSADLAGKGNDDIAAVGLWAGWWSWSWW